MLQVHREGSSLRSINAPTPITYHLSLFQTAPISISVIQKLTLWTVGGVIKRVFEKVKSYKTQTSPLTSSAPLTSFAPLLLLALALTLPTSMSNYLAFLCRFLPHRQRAVANALERVG